MPELSIIGSQTVERFGKQPKSVVNENRKIVT